MGQSVRTTTETVHPCEGLRNSEGQYVAWVGELGGPGSYVVCPGCPDCAEVKPALPLRDPFGCLPSHGVYDEGLFDDEETAS